MDTAASQELVAVLKIMTKSPRSQKLRTIFAVTDDLLLRKASTEQVGQTLGASMAVQIYAVGDGHVAQWFPTLFCEKAFSPHFSKGARFSRAF